MTDRLVRIAMRGNAVFNALSGVAALVAAVETASDALERFSARAARPLGLDPPRHAALVDVRREIAAVARLAHVSAVRRVDVAADAALRDVRGVEDG